MLIDCPSDIHVNDLNNSVHVLIYAFSGVEPYLLFSIFVCSVIRSNSNTINSDAGKKDQNSL